MTPCPLSQLVHATAPAGGFWVVTMLNCRQVPALMNCHHAGTVGAADASSSVAMLPCTFETAAGRMNVARRFSEPLFVLQAKSRLLAPPSPKQAFQRSATPAAWAVEATRASSRARSVRWVTMGASGVRADTADRGRDPHWGW